MKVTIFTDNMIRKLKPESKKFIRSEGNGFTVRVMPSGVKTWLYIYTFDDKRREMNLGNYPEVTLETSRGRFEEARRKVKNGIDPMLEKEEAAEARRKAPTVTDLVEEYVERHARRFKRSWEKDQRILNREVVPAWGERKAADVVKRDVIRLLETILDRNAPIMANNTLAVIRKMFNWAVEQDILEITPCLGIKPPAAKVSRERVLTAAEIKVLWANLDRDDLNISDGTRCCLKLVLLTAQRPGEVIGMHASEIDGHWWTIPAERAKNGKTHRVYLTATALGLIGDTAGKGYIFPTPHRGKERPVGDTTLTVAVSRNLAIRLTDSKGKTLYDEQGKPATENRLGVDHFTPHDLRRTGATFMASMGFMDEIIDAVLNHVKQGIIRTYNRHDYDKEKQQALEAWERKLISITAGVKSNVVSIGSRKKPS